jgi:hypothetical protein
MPVLMTGRGKGLYALKGDRAGLGMQMLFDIGYEGGVRPVLAIPETPVPDGARAGYAS